MKLRSSTQAPASRSPSALALVAHPVAPLPFAMSTSPHPVASANNPFTRARCQPPRFRLVPFTPVPKQSRRHHDVCRRAVPVAAPAQVPPRHHVCGVKCWVLRAVVLPLCAVRRTPMRMAAATTMVMAVLVLVLVMLLDVAAAVHMPCIHWRTSSNGSSTCGDAVHDTVTLTCLCLCVSVCLRSGCDLHPVMTTLRPVSLRNTPPPPPPPPGRHVTLPRTARWCWCGASTCRRSFNPGRQPLPHATLPRRGRFSSAGVGTLSRRATCGRCLSARRPCLS